MINCSVEYKPEEKKYMLFIALIQNEQYGKFGIWQLERLIEFRRFHLLKSVSR